MGRARKYTGGPNVLGSMYTKYPHTEPIVKAVKLVMSRQLVYGLVSLRVRVTLMRSSRTAHGHKRLLKGSSVGLVRFHTRTSCLLLLSGGRLCKYLEERGASALPLRSGL
jgi:hypothetical protein